MAKRNNSYSVDLSTPSGPGPWANSRVVTKSTAVVNGLTSGQRVWFRVAAIGAAGQDPWSDPATKIVSVRMRPRDAAY